MLARRLLHAAFASFRYFMADLPSTGMHTEACISNHTTRAKEYDKPVAALIRDLDATGLLKDTLVMGVTEFGRTPVSQGAGKTAGRDHHPTASPAGWQEEA